MDTVTTDTTAPDKAITVDVPADRVPEFYAWYAKFLAGESFRGRRGGRGRHGHGPHGHRHGGMGRCHPDHESHGPHDQPAERTEPAPAQTRSAQPDA